MTEPLPTPTPPETEATKALVSALLGIVAMIVQGIAAGEPWWVAALAALGFGTVTGATVYHAPNNPKAPR